MKNVPAVRVGIVAADPLRTVGIEAILNDTSGLLGVPVRLRDIAASGVAAVLLDERIAGARLHELLARLRHESPDVKLVVFGQSDAHEHVQSIIGSGAKGYLTETAGEDEVRMALEVVLDGSVWAPRKVLARLIESGGIQGAQATTQKPVAGKMTPRELEVLDLLMDGRTNRDIASAMGIDETTVKAHLGRMLRKTGSNNRVELTLRAMSERR